MAHLLIGFLRWVTRVFFRAVEVSGAELVPRQGAVIFVGNHPNSLLDPILVLTTCGRRVRFAAKEVLFRGPLLPALSLLGCVPIKRRQDQVPGAPEDGATTGAPGRVDNSEAFDALLAVLAQGGAFGIFPEGISHTRPELAPLKTGAARVALRAMANGIAVQIVPVGLHYRRRERMRSRVLVQYGVPWEVTATGPLDTPERMRDAARALTTTIEQALRSLTINTPDFDTLRVLETVRRLYRPDHVRLSLTQTAALLRRFIAYWEKLQDDEEVKALFRDVVAYQDALRALGLKDSDLRAGGTSRLVRAERLLAHALFMVIELPLAIPGLILHAPLLVAAVFAGEALTTRGDVRATIKMTVLTAATMAAYGLAGILVGTSQGVMAALGTVVVLALSGHASIAVLERQSDLRRGLGIFVALLHLDASIEDLVARRERLRTRLLSLVDRHAGTIERIIPPEEHGPPPWLGDEDAD
jgi:glycerol-3-phosphate O-acyltransferase/dihydroxyacetone phosphate acyltransferase